jgi:biopolymer transport protein ExbD
MKASFRAKRMDRNHRRMKQVPKLNLVSLMDIFTILVFFLMVNSGDVEVLQSDKNIKLPESVAEQKPALTLLIKISDQDLIVQGRKVASVSDILSQSSNEIEELSKELEYLASRKPLLSHNEKERGRSVIIMGDQNIPYKLLKRVMATCAQTDYRDISLAVSKMVSEEPSEDAVVEQQGS